MRILGIDEAGRGCVLGPLCIGAFVVDGVDDATLRLAGADDSKRLSHKRRVEARAKLADLGTPEVILIQPPAIDAGNLNALEETAIVALVRKYAPDRVIVDALGHPRTIPATIERLNAQAPADWLMEPKADGTYPSCGAASIFAKTTRDQIIEDLKAEFGDFGSGYPSDPKTRRWLADWHAAGKAWPSFVRTRWGTIRDLEQESLFKG